ncbi:type I polyketide synthase [Denitrobaculum tricleocarpae]|uniref:SDR family NAD(P)-dependent oxidoreductase n=1 Tax=Denitrobaculum tricleocarpae TaxID=2591009 RepID=A0A545TN18_9PROT|nr:type I polyketide synthase [Denitrobaculum tricleocarpae]TQV78630.1 SDR family NAD(P)-dependent oxidoreductase [Denitrobaculum tricleocarpae]
MPHSRKLSPIAIVAMGSKFPGRGTTSGFWRDIVEGVDTSSDIPETHWRVEDYYDPDPKTPDKTYSSRGAFIPAFPFDPIAYGTPPRVIETTDTVQLLALHVAKQVLADAQPDGTSPVDLERTSVVLGVAAGTELIGDMASRLNGPIWIKAMREEGIAQPDAERVADRIRSHFTDWRESTFPGLLGNVVAGRIANRFGLGGSNFTTDAACASSLAAIQHAAQELWLGDSDLVLAGGADALNNIFMYMCFSKTPAMSASGKCRPFSDDADGTLMGEGCGIFALRRLEDAEKDGNRILAVITGIGASSDGRGSSVYAPRAGGQALAIRRALNKAGISPRSVELVEAHGTGTRAGDAAEFEGLREVFGEADPDTGAWCALGSIKSQIGHTKSAAGAAGLAKVVSALHHKVLPPTINVRAPNPKLGIDGSAFYLNTKARPWIRSSDHPRRASVSSFGFGGTNFHITLEERRGPASRRSKYRTAPTELFLFSASSGAGLSEQVQALIAECSSDADLPHYAAASQRAFNPDASQRLAFVIGTNEDLTKIAVTHGPSLKAERAFSIGNIIYEKGPSIVASGRTAYLFAGQGSQYLGMGADLAMTFDLARAPWDWAARDPVLRSLQLHGLSFPPPAFTDRETERQSAELTRTENAQPSIGLVALGQLGILNDLGLRPDCLAGHSFGEVMALHAAGALDATAAIRLARARGEAMAQAAQATPGGMLAVFAERDFVDAYLAEGAGGLVLANDNAPDQVILSGPVAAIEKAEKELTDQKLRVRRLSVSTAFHSPLVAAAATDLEAAIENARLRAPRLPVYANLTGKLYSNNEAEARAVLKAQLTAPVRFRETIEKMYEDGVRTFVEVGPSSVLSGLAGAILKTRPHVATSLDQRQMHGVTAFHRALAKLAVAGHRINFEALWHEAPAPEPRRQPKQHEIMLNGANYGKPYPSQTHPNQTHPSLTCDDELSAPVHARCFTGTLGSTNGAHKDAEACHRTREPHAGSDDERGRLINALSDSQLALQRASEATSELQAAETVRAVMAEKTGYPADMLELGMELDAELGFDSIKQVEILSALREKLPHMPEIEPSRLAELRSIQLIVDAITPTPSGQAQAGQAKNEVQAVEVPVTPGPSDAAAVSGTALSEAAETVRDVVAEKTGYPSDMLDLDLDLEAELGIDSIKQVEILSALRETLPDMPEIEPAQLAELRTLQQIAEAVVPVSSAQTQAGAGQVKPDGTVAGRSLNGVGPTQPTAQAVEVPVTPGPSDAAVREAARSEATETVRDVVAKKTGYPADMLDLELDLEAELGIDSIKQVEILSALREELPDMPEIEPAQLAELRTLQQIAEAVVPVSSVQAEGGRATPDAKVAGRSLNGAGPTQPTAQAVEVPVTPGPSDAADVSEAALSEATETVRDVVAEKTGYPADMLDLDLDLEAELGIDSIKQVEILSALREKLPDMPEIEPAQLAELRSLQQIAEAAVPVPSAQVEGGQVEGGQAEVEQATPAATIVARSLNGAGPTQPTAQAVEVPVTPGPSDAGAVSGTALSEATETVRDVVAEKTGYPADMLDLDLDLEAELGIDSIKQVEILSALREKLLEMPEIEPDQLAELRTLQQIAEAVVPSASYDAPASQMKPVEPPVESDLSLATFVKKAANLGLSRQVVDVDVAPSCSDQMLLSNGQRIEITRDVPDLSGAIASAFQSLGITAEVVDAPSEDADAVIVTSGLADSRGAAEVSWTALAMARSVAETTSRNAGWFILLQDSAGDFGRMNRTLDKAARGGLTGLAKTAALEWPDAKLRVIDVDRHSATPEDTARRIAQEILFGGGPLEVGLKQDGRRLTPITKPAPYRDNGFTLDHGANIVVTGGGRGITSRIVRRLAGLGRMRFLILARSELRQWPSDIPTDADELQIRSLLAEKARETGQVTDFKAIAAEAGRLVASRDVAETLAAVKAAGSEVTYVAVDVADVEGVAAAVGAFREQNGPISGLIHGAGQLADKLIKDKTEEQFRRVFEPKVLGFQSVWSAIEADNPSFAALFSSVSGRYGNPGQADYAMANEILNRFAWCLRQLRPQMHVMSINWGPWDFGMVTEGMRAQFEARNTALIPEDVGVDAFVAELFHGALDQPEIVFAGQLTPTSGR